MKHTFCKAKGHKVREIHSTYEEAPSPHINHQKLGHPLFQKNSDAALRLAPFFLFLLELSWANTWESPLNW